MTRQTGRVREGQNSQFQLLHHAIRLYISYKFSNNPQIMASVVKLSTSYQRLSSCLK